MTHQQFYESVQREEEYRDAYAAEQMALVAAERALTEWESTGYEISDPKHDLWLERLQDMVDTLEKKYGRE